MTSRAALIPLVLAITAALTVPAAADKGLTIDDMLAMQRIGEPAVSPDGKQVAFSVRDTDFDAKAGLAYQLVEGAALLSKVFAFQLLSK